MNLTTEQLAEKIGAELVGDGSVEIASVAAIESASPVQISFVDDKQKTAGIADSKAGAFLVGQRRDELSGPQLLVKNLDAALIKVLGIFAPKLRPPKAGIDKSASVADDVIIGKGVSIGASAVIEAGVQIGAHTVISAGCKVGQNSRIGENCRLDANVVIYHNCTLGNNVIIQANSTIGSVGFGYCFIDGEHRLVPHNGTVVIEDFVEIGANSCIDRAKFGATKIGVGTKIDNMVQIGHNVEIGRCCLLVSQVGISGSCKLGDGVVMGGQVGMKDHTSIGSGAMVGAQAGILNDIEPNKKMLGAPAVEAGEALRQMAAVRKLPEMARQLKRLIKKVEILETAKNDKE